MDWLGGLAPIPASVSALLIALSTLTSMISASMGVGGGTLLIMTMAQVMPAAALIPVQGLGVGSRVINDSSMKKLRAHFLPIFHRRYRWLVV
ncbi:hypothetical protein ACUN9Y_14630 [Halomonas sp. V046]|uniref:hypothetical protein n=1 Tax=Halomonas sp. V046 TaxID=3459611 RepID=UPI004044E0F2